MHFQYKVKNPAKLKDAYKFLRKSNFIGIYELKTASEIKQKSEGAPKPMPKLGVRPRPKQFKILSTEDNIEETINDRQETQTTPTAKPKIPEASTTETGTDIGG